MKSKGDGNWGGTGTRPWAGTGVKPGGAAAAGRATRGKRLVVLRACVWMALAAGTIGVLQNEAAAQGRSHHGASGRGSISHGMSHGMHGYGVPHGSHARGHSSATFGLYLPGYLWDPFWNEPNRWIWSPRLGGYAYGPYYGYPPYWAPSDPPYTYYYFYDEGLRGYYAWPLPPRMTLRRQGHHPPPQHGHRQHRQRSRTR